MRNASFAGDNAHFVQAAVASGDPAPPRRNRSTYTVEARDEISERKGARGEQTPEEEDSSSGRRAQPAWMREMPPAQSSRATRAGTCDTPQAKHDTERGAERYMAKMQAKHDKEMKTLHEELAALAKEAMRHGVQ